MQHDVAGAERTHAQVGSGKSSRTVRSSVNWTNQRTACWGDRTPLGVFGSIADALSGKRWDTLPAGEHLWPFEFNVPKGAPAVYAGRHVDVTWKLSAQVDVPRGFDLTQNWTIRVIPPIPGEVPARHGRHQKSVQLEAWIDPGPAGPGAEVRGRFRVRNTGGKTIRAAHVDVVRLERAVASGHVRETSQVESGTKFRGASLGEEPVEFAVRLPDSYCPWEGKYSSLAYGVKVWLDVAWGFDVEVTLRTH
ncbi:MAG: hypothetical protein HUU15_19790 [Candidatus Brocadiae bacterium]|nr:hypothetical protein [Candidatus Brocadiia bacterium]